MKKVMFFSAVFIVAVFAGNYLSSAEKEFENRNLPVVRNLIIMIPDGMSHGGYTLARWMKDGNQMNMDPLACGLVRTFSSGSAITDSAAAATAYATGFKTQNGWLGVMPGEIDMPGLSASVYDKAFARLPVANLMEAARMKGKSTGLVSICPSVEATPAGFSSHFPSREAFETIAEQQIYCGLDLFLGAGDKFFKPENRQDKEDLLSELRNQGYKLVGTREELLKSSSPKLWGHFADGYMSFDIDKAPEEPSLAEMTEKAIELLSKGKNGFVLMVEGSKIDPAAHSNEPVGLVSDILAFDLAVGKALEFAKKDGHTAILIMSDHGNGGITVGTRNNQIGNHPSEFLVCLKKAKNSGEKVASLLKPGLSEEEVRKIVSEHYGIEKISEEEMKKLLETIPQNNNKKTRVLLGEMMSRRSNIGWTHDNHVADDVVLFSYLPFDYKFGTFDNTDIPKLSEKMLGLSLKECSFKLFRDAAHEFKEAGLEMKEDKSETGNPKIIVVNGSKTVEYPLNKNYAFVNGKKVKFSAGQAIFTGRKWYLPEEAVSLAKN